MPYSLTLPSGFVATEIPDDVSREEALMLLRRNLPQEFPAPEEAPFTKGLEAFKATVGTGIEALTSPESANREIARRALLEQQDIGARFTGGADFSKVKDIYEEKGFFPALGEAGSQIVPALKEQAPIIGSSIVGARVGALAGSYGGPAGSLILGTVGAATPIFLQLFGSNIERQAAEKLEKGQPLDINESDALQSATLGTASEFALLMQNLVEKYLAKCLEAMLKNYFKLKTQKRN